MGEHALEAPFRVTLEYVRNEQPYHVFRVAFEGSFDRLLLTHPDVTGLKFTHETGVQPAEWRTRIMATEPLDEFVLTVDSRIAFDLKAAVNVEPTTDPLRRWTIQLPQGRFVARYLYTSVPDEKRYDFLARRSRFAAITIPWGGSVWSNEVPFTV